MNTVLVILNAVVNSLWQSLAVTALVWLALKFAPRGTLSNNAATRHAIWWATLGVVLVLPVAPRLIQVMRQHPQSAVVAATKTPEAAAPAVAAEPFIVTVAPGPPQDGLSRFSPFGRRFCCGACSKFSGATSTCAA